MKSQTEAVRAGAKPRANSDESRRSWFHRLGIGGLLAGMCGMGYAFVRSLVPNVLYEEPQRFKAGVLDQFPEGATFLEDRRVFVVREQRTFHAVSAVCTHLGCTVKMVSLSEPKKVMAGGREFLETREFQCPCHGSKYYGDGTNFAGPAPKPLACYRVEAAPEDGQLIVDLSEPVSPGFRLTV